MELPELRPQPHRVHDFAAAKAAKTFYDAFPGKPLLANSYQERYLPGSTFKVIAATAALESGKYTLDSYFPPVDSYLPPQTTKPIHNYGGSTCGGTFVEVFRRSCNTAVRGDGGERRAARHGRHGRALRLQLRAALRPARPAKSVFGTVADFVNNIPLLAIAGFGQGNTQATPLEMALVAAGVANGGQIMTPYVVDKTIDRQGRTLTQTTPSPWRKALEPQTATTLRDLMVEVVNNGTAKCCMQLAGGIQAAAKTGTAQLNPEGQPPPATRGSSPSHRPRSPATPSPSW